MADFLSVLWFVLVAVLWIGYFILEGFDLGTGMLLRIVAKNDKERGQVVRTVGPHWDGNEVWLLTAGGATFASSPEWYATMFSGMYLALFLILVCLILRIGALEWRNSVARESWRNTWDWIHTVAAWLVPVLLGVAIGNWIQGMAIKIVNPATPFEGIDVATVTADRAAALSTNVHNLVGGGLGPFVSLLTPYTIFGGVVIALLCLAQGAFFLTLKTSGDVRDRVSSLTPKVSLVATGLTAVFAIIGQLFYTDQTGFVLIAWIFLGVAALALIAATFFAWTKSFGKGFIANSIGLLGAVSWVFSLMFPNVLKSSIDPAYSLTVWDSSASVFTHIVMTVATVIFVPIVLGYTIYSYIVFKKRITAEDSEEVGLDPAKVREGANFLVG